jgi:hypothetical protein
VDYAELMAGKQQTIELNQDGELSLYRIGDTLVRAMCVPQFTMLPAP